MRIGRFYRVLGIPAYVHQWPNTTCSVEANSIQPWEPECKALKYLLSELQNTSIGVLIADIFNVSKYSEVSVFYIFELI